MEGNVVGVLGTYEDITERKWAEETLKESEEKFRLLSEQNLLGIVILQDGLVKYVNNAASEITEYSIEEALDWKPNGFSKLFHPDDLEFVIKQAQKKQTGDKDSTIHYSYRIITKSGNVKWVDQYSKTITFAGKYANLITLTDITERKRAEEALRESEAQKTAILDASVDRIRLTDKDGRIIWTNKTHQRDLNIPPEELVGKLCYEALIGRDSPCPECPAQKTLKTGKVEHTTLARSQMGEIDKIRYLDSYAVPIKNESGEIVNIMQITRDITERKKSEKELKRSREELRSLADHLQSIREEERTTIAREIHDELAQALTALKMDISWLSKKLPKDQKMLLEKTRAMTKLTDTTIKTVKKISTELRPGLLDDLGLVPAIEWQAEEFKNRTGITYKLTIDPEEITLDPDRSTAIVRIFQETLTNIARHAKATMVTASLKEKDDKLELRVRDNGKGITKEQISDPQSFGLMGIRERAKSWGGEVKIKGVDGEGTTVTLRIPIEEISRKGAKDAK